MYSEDFIIFFHYVIWRGYSFNSIYRKGKAFQILHSKQLGYTQMLKISLQVSSEGPTFPYFREVQNSPTIDPEINWQVQVFIFK